jgi:hypothetical protein
MSVKDKNSKFLALFWDLASDEQPKRAAAAAGVVAFVRQAEHDAGGELTGKEGITNTRRIHVCLRLIGSWDHSKSIVRYRYRGRKTVSFVDTERRLHVCIMYA